MPFHLNQVNIAGTMTRDAEVNYTPKGTAVANLSIAINRTWKDEKGAKHEETTFVEITAFGKTAEIIGEYTGKGHTIMVEGRLKLDSWDDKQTGKKRQKLFVICEKFHFVSSPRKDDDSDEEDARIPSKPPQKPQYSKPPPRDPDLDGDTDEIPF